MSILVNIAILSIATIHCLYVVYYWLKTERDIVSNDEGFDPSTGVILCLRGAEPQVEGCLTGLSSQTRDFQLYCVFDNEMDPAVSIVKSHAENFQNQPILLFADDISDQRSLKCNSLLHALEEVDQTLEVLAFIDADVCPDPNWLADLVGPLVNKSIAITTGNRWYANDQADLGNSVRQCWNAAAVVQMMIYQIAWGGSWAGTTDAIRQSGLAEHLKTAFCEDTALNRIFDKRQVYRVNSLVTLNDESAPLQETMGFITRQLLTVRMYHRAWPLVLGHGVLVFLVNAIALAAFLLCIVFGETSAARQIFAAVCYLQVVNLFSLYFVARKNETILENRGIRVGSILQRPFGFFLGALVAQFVHPYCAIKAAFLSRTRWAGVDYDVTGNTIKLLNYHPSRAA